MSEVWKDIRGFKGRYQISSEGRVLSLKRFFLRHRKRVWIKQRILKQCAHAVKIPYPIVCLSKKGKLYYPFVHLLVLTHFVGPRPRGKEACHFPDSSPLNNNVTNLRWDSKSGNYQDRIANGTDAKSLWKQGKMWNQYTKMAK